MNKIIDNKKRNIKWNTLNKNGYVKWKVATNYFCRMGRKLNRHICVILNLNSRNSYCSKNCLTDFQKKFRTMCMQTTVHTHTQNICFCKRERERMKVRTENQKKVESRRNRHRGEIISPKKNRVFDILYWK